MRPRAKPKTPYARKLRKLFLKITYIRNKIERDQFLNLLYEWEEVYGLKIEVNLKQEEFLVTSRDLAE